MARRQHLVGATCSARRKQRYRDPKQRAAPPSAAPPHASKRSLGAKTHGTLTGVVVNSVGHRAQSKALRPSQPLQAWNLATFSRDFAVQQGAPRRKPRTPFTAWGKRTSLNVPGLTLQLFTLKVYSSSERKHTVTRIPRPKDPPFRHHGWVVSLKTEYGVLIWLSFAGRTQCSRHSCWVSSTAPWPGAQR